MVPLRLSAVLTLRSVEADQGEESTSCARRFKAPDRLMYEVAEVARQLPVAAAEAAVVLAIIIVLFRHKQQLDVNQADSLKH